MSGIRFSGARSGLGRQFTWLFCARVTGALCQGVSVALVARWTEPQRFGLFAAVLAIVLSISAVSDMGLGPQVTKDRAADKSNPRIAHALRINDRANVTLALLISIGLASVAILYNLPILLLLLPLGVWAASEKSAEVWLSVATADGLTRINFWSICVRRILGLALFVLSATFGINTFLSYSVAFAVSGTAGAFLTHRALHREIYVDATPRETSRAVLFAAFPYWLNTAGGQLRNLDSPLVTGLIGSFGGGLYSAPARILTPMKIVLGTLGALVLPHVARDRYVSRSLRLACASAVMGVLLVVSATVIYSDEILFYGLGEAYTPGSVALKWISVSMLVASVTGLLSGYLQALDDQYFVGIGAACSSILILVSVASGALLAQQTGAALGSALGYLVSGGLFFARALFISRRQRRAPREVFQDVPQ